MNSPLSACSRRWLVVDDEAALSEIVALHLTELGLARVENFTSPTKARETFSARPHDFELVVTDRDMPNLDGLALARALHAQSPNLKIVLVTAHHDDLTAKELEAAGICAIVPKPFTLDRLEATVRALTLDPAITDAETSPMALPRAA